jgi:patatin-like phospholipase/acyl hydrolase
MAKRHKVLIIAGGGVFGCIPAHFLGTLPPTADASLDNVDMISGCSIGGILAAAYASGHAFDHIDQVFQERADDCFDRRFMACINPLACPTYDNDSINKVLEEMIGNKTLGQVRDIYPHLDVCIPTLNLTDDKYKVWDNIDGTDDDVPLKVLASMTSAAPSYYYGIDWEGKCYVDGGIIEVAPLLTATTALRQKRGVEFKDMDVLMIGTGRDIDENPITTKKYNGMCLLELATKVIVPYVTLSNEMATRYWGNFIGYGSFTYYNPCITNGALDDVDQIPDCIKQCEKFKDEFADVWSNWLKA